VGALKKVSARPLISANKPAELFDYKIALQRLGKCPSSRLSPLAGNRGIL
jgi:hypothetical protein